MKENEKLQILVTYQNGEMQAWGYDGPNFPTIPALINDVAADFPDGFFDVYKNVTEMTLIWGPGLPLGDELESTPTKQIEPACSTALTDKVAVWLEEIGVIHGN